MPRYYRRCDDGVAETSHAAHNARTGAFSPLALGAQISGSLGITYRRLMALSRSAVPIGMGDASKVEVGDAFEVRRVDRVEG
jgi:hypothetical protein